eukprot:CAMPEP_0169083950 /NCGR_PEP_ID=MMETSP1015-20121227/12351_1 /TAXON_ID=342587 /ORGANISM="Karlodinium micrum, Strain CCMP2283" /LENGTH=91 /DNA_ID=CAMNT_0009143907 /DNA_START=64 /DNA_END=339 /DNA_ORIENTATION=-
MAGDSAASGSAKPTSAALVGGRRQVATRGKTSSSGANSGRKAGSGGSMLSYTSDSAGLKVGPTTVLVMALAFMAIVCCLHIIGKFRSAASA